MQTANGLSWADEIDNDASENVPAPAADDDGRQFQLYFLSSHVPAVVLHFSKSIHSHLYVAPPGFENQKPTPGSIDDATAALASVAVSESAVIDEPDTGIKHDRLQDGGTGEIKKVTADNTIYASAKTFEELGLSQELLQGLYTEMKFERPSRIQAETLPLILTPPHKSLIAQAHNGSGKTTCFTLSMLSRVDPSLKQPQVCIFIERERK